MTSEDKLGQNTCPIDGACPSQVSVAGDIGSIKASVNYLIHGQDELKETTTKTREEMNGRLGVLERWQARLLGGGAVLVLLALPTALMEIDKLLTALKSGG